MKTPTIVTKQLADLQEKRTKCEVWTRVMGYHRPVSQFNSAKQSEYYSRQVFEEGSTIAPDLQ